jgi:hypothetical protein
MPGDAPGPALQPTEPPLLQAAVRAERTNSMRLFMFKSEAKSGLQAFTGDPGGEQLPSRHGPWHAVGVVREDKAPPHNMDRAGIEQAIADQGFQMYRMKPKKMD